MSKLTLVTAVLLAVNSYGEVKAKDQPHIFVAKVDHVVDGDSAVVIAGKEKISVRIEGVDAPELKQTFGAKAKEALSKVLPSGTEVVIEDHGKDKYDRMLATVHNREKSPDSISLFLINQGYAWHFAKYNDSHELANAEKVARSKRRGLWSSSVKPTAPWDYRIKHDRGEVMEEYKVHKPSPSFYQRQTRMSFTHWINLDDGKRHKVGCPRANHRQGRPCTSTEGVVCKVCGT